MTEPRSLSVQSVIYKNAAIDVGRAADATANSVRLAREEGLIGSWELHLGDCSPEPALSNDEVEAIRDVVESAGGVLSVTSFGENLGSAAGHNRLAAETECDLLVILNPDGQMAPDCVSALRRSLAPGVGIVEARQVPLEHPKTFTRGTGETSWASTACAMTPRTAFEEVDGFDSATFFLYCDDVDYSWRLRLAGYRVLYQPAAAIFHDKRLTLSGDWPAGEAEIYYSAEAALLLAHKYSQHRRVRELMRQFGKAPDGDAARRAADEYRRREREGRLPTPIDRRHQVAEFVKGNYAVHRF